MKLTNAQRKRLAVLLSKTTLQLSPDEVKELATLQALAEADSITLDEAFVKEALALQDDGDTALTADQLKGMVSAALADTLASKGVDQAAILKAIEDADKGHVTAADIQAAVKNALAPFTPAGTAADTAEAIKAAVAEAQKGALTADQLASAFERALTSAGRVSSKNVFPTDGEGDTDLVAHRAGNLTVAGKELLNVCLGLPQQNGIDAKMFTRATARGSKALDGIRTKTLTTGGAATGAELIPSDLSSELQMRLYLESALAAAMISQEITMPTDVYKMPLKTTRTAFRRGSEAPGSDPAGSEPGTGLVTLDAQKLIGIADYSYEADEDAIIPILPMLQDDLASGAADALEDALINGDTSATHQDTDTHTALGTATLPARLFAGLRRYAIAGSSTTSWATSGAIAANILAALKGMGKYGIRRSELLLVCGPRGYNDLVGLAETLTVEKVGNPNLARILTGAAGVIFGVPIIVSERNREDLSATGVNAASGNTFGSMLFIHKPSWYLGVRRGFTVETDSDRKKQIKSVIASFRRAFVPRETTSATVPNVRLAFNYTA
jgi:HK97 family phage major capsid protein